MCKHGLSADKQQSRGLKQHNVLSICLKWLRHHFRVSKLCQSPWIPWCYICPTSPLPFPSHTHIHVCSNHIIPAFTVLYNKVLDNIVLGKNKKKERKRHNKYLKVNILDKFLKLRVPGPGHLSTSSFLIHKTRSQSFVLHYRIVEVIK